MHKPSLLYFFAGLRKRLSELTELHSGSRNFKPATHILTEEAAKLAALLRPIRLHFVQGLKEVGKGEVLVSILKSHELQLLLVKPTSRLEFAISTRLQLSRLVFLDSNDGI